RIRLIRNKRDGPSPARSRRHRGHQLRARCPEPRAARPPTIRPPLSARALLARVSIRAHALARLRQRASARISVDSCSLIPLVTYLQSRHLMLANSLTTTDLQRAVADFKDPETGLS